MNCIILMCLLGAAAAVPLENGQLLEKNLFRTQTEGVQDRIPVVYQLPKTGLVSRQDTLNQQPINQEFYSVQYPDKYERIYQTPVYGEKGSVKNVQLIGQNRFEIQPFFRGYLQNQPIYKYSSGVEGLSTLNQGGVQQPIHRYTPGVESTVSQYQPLIGYQGFVKRFGVPNQPIYTRDEGLGQSGLVGVQQPIYRYTSDIGGLNQYNHVGVQQQSIYRDTNKVEGLTHLNGGVQFQQPIYYGYNKEVGVHPFTHGGYVHSQPIYRGQTSDVNVYDVTGYKTGPIYEHGTGSYPTPTHGVQQFTTL